jgi:lactoylglutathione lyase
VVDRAFPVIYARDVEKVSSFYAALGFLEHFRLPSDGTAGYVGLRRGAHEMAVTTVDAPAEFIGISVGSEPRFEMFVYVEDLERALIAAAAAGGRVLREPATMFWGERLAWVSDPEGNPVALALASGGT